MRCSAAGKRRCTSPARKAARRWRCGRRLGLDHSQVQVLAEIQLEKILATLDAETRRWP
jgi:predicted ATP-dependent serine protease